MFLKIVAGILIFSSLAYEGITGFGYPGTGNNVNACEFIKSYISTGRTTAVFTDDIRASADNQGHKANCQHPCRGTICAFLTGLLTSCSEAVVFVLPVISKNCEFILHAGNISPPCITCTI